MSVHSSATAVTVRDVQGFKDRGERFIMLTAYDYLTAQILDESGVPLLLVGDSLGMVVLGHDSTIPVTLDDVIHHTKAVRRGAKRAMVVSDLTFGDYQTSLDDGVRSAARVMKEGGANAVKIEGGGPVIELTARLTSMGVPVMGHLGLTPQSVNQMGGYKVQGREHEAARKVIADIVALEEAGAFAVVIEAVPAALGREMTQAVRIPTIGIGAGPDTDGQVLVIQDMLGMTGGRLPRFVKTYADLRGTITDAAKAFSTEVADGEYPGPEHCY